MCFYNFYWPEKELSESEQQVYCSEANHALCTYTVQHPGILELQAYCPYLPYQCTS
jgi:hypothetical protein